MRELDIFCESKEEAKKLCMFINCLAGKIISTSNSVTFSSSNKGVNAKSWNNLVKVHIPEPIEESAGMSPIYWERLLVPKS